MPRKTEWIHKITEIIEQAGQLSAGLLDRSAIESMFNVSPRQATRILQRLGAGNVGGALVISADVFAERLSRLQQNEEVVFEQQRREQFRRKLEKARRETRSRHIEIPSTQEAFTLQQLPGEVKLEQGELRIRFSAPLELLERLMLLTRAISEDWETFSQQCDRAGERPHPLKSE